MELTDPLAELTPLEVGPVDGEEGLDPFAVAEDASPFTLPPPPPPSFASSSKLTHPDLAGEDVLLPPAVSSAMAEGGLKREQFHNNHGRGGGGESIPISPNDALPVFPDGRGQWKSSRSLHALCGVGVIGRSASGRVAFPIAVAAQAS